MTYPYANRNLFEEPERYSFADCVGPEYLAAWRASRSRIRDRLDTSLPEQEVERVEISETQFANSRSLRRTLNAVLDDLRGGRITLEKGQQAIAPYVLKYEVFKRLFAFYQNDGRRHPDSPMAELETYVRFAECLAEIATRERSLKHLSALLKLCDALASLGADEFPPLAAVDFARVLEIEQDLVTELEIG